jgi:hypothetical protein
MPRVKQLYNRDPSGDVPPADWIPETYGFSPYLTPNQSSPFHRYQTPVQRPGANVNVPQAVQPGHRA